MKVRRRLEAAHGWWGARIQLLPAIVSLALLCLLAAGTLVNTSWPLSALVGADPARHTVSEGDTVANIAVQYGTSVATIAALNDIPDPNVIYPGQELVVAPETSAAPSPTPAPAAPASAESEQTYVVQTGDTLWNIAEQYGVDVEAIMDRNAMLDSELLAVGQTVVIPNGEGRGPGAAMRSVPRIDPYGRIWVPFRSQLDGSPAAGSNCGPATLGMAMSYFGEWWTTAGIRRSVNEFQGTWDPDAGSTWEALAYAARKRGFRVVGLYDGSGSNYRQWSIEDLVTQTKAGRPVILLTRYWSLPEHGDSAWWGDHYITFLGLTPNGDVIYHDAAFGDDSRGAYRTMTKDRLIRAWTRTATGLQYTAFALEWPGASAQP